ncbi:MAG: PKD domain-containing protein [Candidatus Methanoperedens sp.]|nr:PKD domain-containing protein [Candidatus Methanoperedens sp.]
MRHNTWKLLTGLLIGLVVIGLVPGRPAPSQAGTVIEVSTLFSSGPWYSRVPSDATYTRESRIGVLKHSYTEWSAPIYRVASSETVPLVRITNIYSGRVETWPIPSYAQPAPEADAHMAVIHYGTGMVYEMWSARWTSATAIQAGGMVAFPLSGKGISDPPHRRVTASGFAVSAGMITREDFLNPVTGTLDLNQRIDHALTITLPSRILATGYVAPAVGGEESGSAGSSGIKMGERFALPRNVNVDALNVHPLTREILRAARDYGMYVNDGNGSALYNSTNVANVRLEPGLTNDLFGVSSNDLLDRVMSETYTVLQQHGVFKVSGGTTAPPTPTSTVTATPPTATPTPTATQPPANTPPGVSVAQGTVTVNEGQTASVSGAVGDLEGGPLTLSASQGTVTHHNNGTWSWQYATTDGPAQSQTITVTARDSQGAQGQVSFSLTVQNVAPTASLSLSATTVQVNQTLTATLGSASDASTPDQNAGFTYQFDCRNDGTYETSGSANQATCSYPTAGSYTLRARLTDKDGGASSYTRTVTVTPVPTATATTTTPTATATPTSTPVPTQTTPPPPSSGGASLPEFVLLGQEGVWVQSNTTIHSGHVGANVISGGPFLRANSEVTLDSNVKASTSSVFGDTLTFRSGVQVLNAYGNSLTNSGRILGQRGQPTSLPLVSFPAFPTFEAGSQKVVADYGQTLTLDAGSYGKLEARDGSQVIFTGGVYTFSRAEAWWKVTFTFTAPTEIRIAGTLKANAQTFFLPASGVSPDQVVIYVAGSNGGSDPASAPYAAQIGTNSLVNATVYVPNGTLYLNNDVEATGAFLGRWVRVGQRVRLRLDSAFGAPIAFAAFEQTRPAASPTPVVPAFAADVLTGQAPLTVSFTNQSTGEIASYGWDFGDGGTSTDTHPSHTFTAAGSYTVTLLAMGVDGVVQSHQVLIEVTAPLLPVQAAFTSDVVAGVAPLTVQFTSQVSGDLHSLVWDFGDGLSGSDTHPVHTYLTPGQYPVTLTVTGMDGSLHTAQTVIDVTAPVRPVSAAFITDVTGGEAPLTVTFTSQVDGDLHSLVWDFGDGLSGSDTHPVHTYLTPGQYPVTLTVTGQDGSLHTAQTVIDVTAPVLAAPTAAFAASVLEGEAPLTVQFTSQASGDLHSLVWDFGDGGTSTELHPAYTFVHPGSYPVTLTVTGQDGRVQTAQAWVTVTAPAPALVPVSAAFVPSVLEGTAPLTVQFTSQATGDLHSLWWDFGDGGTSTELHPAYTFVLPGTYTVTLSVLGMDGLSQTAQVSLTVFDPAPPAPPSVTLPPECQAIAFVGAPIVGSPTDHDWLYGTDGNDLIIAGSGHNEIYAGGGDDCILAGGGHDIVYGGAGNDVIFGEDGSDDLYGEDGEDVLISGPSSDAFYGGAGFDRALDFDLYDDWLCDADQGC